MRLPHTATATPFDPSPSPIFTGTKCIRGYGLRRLTACWTRGCGIGRGGEGLSLFLCCRRRGGGGAWWHAHRKSRTGSGGILVRHLYPPRDRLQRIRRRGRAGRGDVGRRRIRRIKKGKRGRNDVFGAIALGDGKRSSGEKGRSRGRKSGAITIFSSRPIAIEYPYWRHSRYHIVWYFCSVLLQAS